MKRFAVLFVLMALLLTSCSTGTYGDAGASNSLPDSIALPDGMLPYAELPKDYSFEQAKQDGCVVHKQYDLVSGQEVWDAFIEKTSRGEPAFVRLAFYTNGGSDGFLQDLTYDGEHYLLYSFESGQEYTREYKYLVRYFDISKNGAVNVGTLHYILIDENSYTWEELERSRYSSDWNNYIDFTLVYTKHGDVEPHGG